MARARAKTTRKAKAGTKKLKRAQKPPSRLASAAATAGRVVGSAVAAVAERIPWNGGTDAVDLLERDHRRLESLLKQGEDTTEHAVKTRTELLDVITRELTAHEL